MITSLKEVFIVRVAMEDCKWEANPGASPALHQFMLRLARVQTGLGQPF